MKKPYWITESLKLATAHSQGSTTIDRDFEKGYVTACAILVEQFNEPKMAAYILREIGIESAKSCRKMGIAEEDIQTLSAVFKQSIVST